MSYPYQTDAEQQANGYYPPPNPVASPPYAPPQPQHSATPPPGPIPRRSAQPQSRPTTQQDPFYPPLRNQTTSPFADPVSQYPTQQFDAAQNLVGAGGRGNYYDDANQPYGNGADPYYPTQNAQPPLDPFEDNIPLLRTNYAPPSLPSQPTFYDQNTQPYDQNAQGYDQNAQGYGQGYDGGMQGGGGYGMGGVPGGYAQDDDAQSMVRYGRIPQRQPRRYKTVKRAFSLLLSLSWLFRWTLRVFFGRRG